MGRDELWKKRGVSEARKTDANKHCTQPRELHPTCISQSCRRFCCKQLRHLSSAGHRDLKAVSPSRKAILFDTRYLNLRYNCLFCGFGLDQRRANALKKSRECTGSE